jgi:hypothetical protein
MEKLAHVQYGGIELFRLIYCIGSGRLIVLVGKERYCAPGTPDIAKA